jgi:hypothetical protein
VGSAASATFRFSADAELTEKPRLKAIAVIKIAGFSVDTFMILLL